jgi:hypothetical protein
MALNTGTRQFLIVIGVVTIVSIGGYAIYAYSQKKKAEEETKANKPKINRQDAISVGAGIASFLTGIFQKKPAAGDAGSTYDPFATDNSYADDVSNESPSSYSSNF